MRIPGILRRSRLCRPMTGENGTGPALQREPSLLLMVDVPVTSSGIRLPIPSFASPPAAPPQSSNQASTLILPARFHWRGGSSGFHAAWLDGEGRRRESGRGEGYSAFGAWGVIYESILRMDSSDYTLHRHNVG